MQYVTNQFRVPSIYCMQNIPFLMFTIPEVFNTYINIQWCVSQTQQNFIMFIIVLGQRVSILTE
jgi:hypothetical protein